MSTTFIPATVGVLTISDTRTLETDKSGKTICDLLESAGHHVVCRHLVKDEIEAIRAQVRDLSHGQKVEILILTGGTGMTDRDVTPEALAPLYRKHIPGFGELFRMISYEEIGTSTIQSRAEAGLVANTVVFALPGSTGACRTALTKIILEQIDNTHKPCNFRQVVGKPSTTHGA